MHEHKGKVILLAGQECCCETPFEAEVKAIRWVAELLDEKGWCNLEWTSDAATVVKEITSSTDPCRWSTKFDMMRIKSLFEENGWKIEWQSRQSNSLANAIAKWTLSNKSPLMVDVFNFDSLHLNFKNPAAFDVLGGWTCFFHPSVMEGFLCLMQFYFNKKNVIVFSTWDRLDKRVGLNNNILFCVWYMTPV